MTGFIGGGVKTSILNIAHRGASAAYPENTMAAFRAAVDMGADMIELDVQLSLDGVPVIFHDARLNSPIKATGYLAEMNVVELQKLDAGSWFRPDFAGERIPTLDEVLAWVKGITKINIELKKHGVETDGLLEEKCVRLVNKYEMVADVLVSSFDMAAIERIKELEPAISTALLFTSYGFKHQKPSTLINELRADAFHCTFGELTQKRFADLKLHHIPVNVYTVNSKKRMKRLIAMGVNGIITNYPNILREVLQQ